MNSFGTIFRISIFGESHGPAVGIIIDGCPPGFALEVADFEEDLARRRSGAHGTTPRKEADIPQIQAGVFKGRTTGAPITLLIPNGDVDSTAYEALKDSPRPGHADFVAHEKFGGFNDYRGGGHFSGRLTVALVAAGVVAKKIIAPIAVMATLSAVGGSSEIERQISEALADGDSVGGLISVHIVGVPVGLGEPFFDSVESLIAHAVFSVPAVKGIEFGAGFNSAAMRGSQMNDPIIDSAGRTSSNNAGGINGGITNGQEITFRVAIKPTASIKKPVQTVDLGSGEAKLLQITGRHDACIALRAPAVLEGVSACVIADLMLRRAANGGSRK